MSADADPDPNATRDADSDGERDADSDGERDTDSDGDRGVQIGQRLRDSLSRTARVARWEVSRSTGTVDRKTVAVLAAMLLVVGVVGFTVVDEGLGLEEEIYTVGVDEGNPYYDVAAESEQFRPVPLEDVSVEDGEPSVDVVLTEQRGGGYGIDYGGDHGEPAYDAFRDAIDAYNEKLMGDEEDEAAAFPVLVDIEYQDRDLEPATGTEGSGTIADDTNAGDSSNGATGTGDGTAGGGTSDGTADADDQGDPRGDLEAQDDQLQVPNVGGSAGGESMVGSPGSLAPPFPFESLVLAFLFVVPMNFVIQTYGSTIMDERIKRRGELLLVAPISRYEIVAGKTLPYLLGLVAIVAGITYAIEGGLLSVLAALPIALLFLAATFAGAMLARSFKELTFVTVTISVCLTTYAFIPAIFTDVHPIALISPLTLIVMDLQNESVRLGEYLFSTGPFYCSAAVLFALGIGLYREEDMFDQKAIPAKVIDAIAGQIDAIERVVATLASQFDTVSRRIRALAGRTTTRWSHAYASPFVLSIVFIPFVFAAQLLVVALLFVVPTAIMLPVVLVLAAAIEEFAKSIHVYAGFARSRFAASVRTGAVLGALSGAGFFVGEKFTHVVQFVGLPELDVGVAAFGPDLSSVGSPAVLLAVIFAPLVLHVVTAVVSAIGASRGRTAYALAFVAATLVHAVYNLGVIALVA